MYTVFGFEGRLRSICFQVSYDDNVELLILSVTVLKKLSIYKVQPADQDMAN